jgi:hypothetical protein
VGAVTKLCVLVLALSLFSIVAAAEVVTITIPSPTTGQIITNGCIPVFAVAGSDVGSKITAWNVFVDGVSRFSAQNTARINARICVPAVSTGSHMVQVKASSATGGAGVSPSIPVSISSVFRIVAPKDEALAPVAGQSFTNGLIRVSASAESPNQISAWGVYIDGVRVFTSFKGAPQVKQYFEVPVGTHNVIVKVWDINGVVRSITATNVLVVKDPMNSDAFVKPPVTAITLANLDRAGALGWKAPKTGGAASCRGDDLVCIAKAPVAIANPVRFVANPLALPVASDGASALFETLPGTEPFGNALYATGSFDNDTVRGHFVLDVWVLPTSANIQTFEIDLVSTIAGKTFMMGTQCNVSAGYWDFWDESAQSATHPLPPHWQHVTPKPSNNDLICDPKPNQWMHLRYHIERGATTYQFVSLELNGVNHSLSELPPSSSRDRGWADGTALQVQLDTNSSTTPYKVYIDKLNLTKW